MTRWLSTSTFFFFNDTATTEIYTLSLHDALPISLCHCNHVNSDSFVRNADTSHLSFGSRWWTNRVEKLRTDVVEFVAGYKLKDRKSTRLNSSHGYISYAVFCLKKKKTNIRHNLTI